MPADGTETTDAPATRSRRRKTTPAGPSAKELGITAQVTESGRVLGVAEVLCDETGRLGSLSYVVPTDLEVHVGYAVHAPFGSREVHGVVVGAGDASKATRELIRVYGRRADPVEIDLARALADRNFATFEQIAVRLAPRSGRGHDPLDAGPVILADNVGDITCQPVADAVTRRMLVRAPLVDPAALAAQEAARLSRDGGQVLVLCPTIELVADVTAKFTSGAARVDTKAKKGAWRGFCEGSVTVAVGTRAAALYSAAKLAGIIVVEEDHPGHIEATQPYTHARDVAVARAVALDIGLALISANPSVAGLGAGVKVLTAGARSDWPSVQVVDRDEFAPGDRLLPPPLAARLSRAGAAGERPVVVCSPHKATRRCVRCGTERACGSCTSSLCRHRDDGPCPRCGQDGIRIVGWDAERLTIRVGTGVEIVPATRLLEAAQAADGSPRLVAVLEVDAALAAPGFAPEAIAAHLVVASARLAGRGGTIVVCTDQPDSHLIGDLCRRRDQLAVARRAWKAAKAANLPPFGRLVTVRSGQAQPPVTANWPGTVYGPRRVGSEWEVLVLIGDAGLSRLRSHLGRLRRGGKVRVSVQ